ncbi:malate dehydrogenase nad, putative [Ichthyophthirius multifiliis]|uniref:Malate dehydrogenase n=1 Tax=Ichthyophthirius multifiliis TaxID=5932 RepID=G0QXG2_ICHMU|nr:malate dehydrogenase nad, putative [Ichthyophthirius multifiliis]EGR30080.1 malate dehydrogenase nad, putative [Ichthyophthirius multifiliis]|eukprot:XP_004031316.1 malate dehydrogenase nad, putative [Ichthyophthirius multifiliis]
MNQDKPINICITGAAGNIAYAMYPLLCSGQIFGPNQHMNIRLLDIEVQKKILEGVVMELHDCAFELVNSIEYGFEPEKMFKDIDIGIFLGGESRRPGMERRDLLQVNYKIFKNQGRVLNKMAKQTTKILVIANPVNTNCLVLLENCPNIPKKNFSCLTRLDHNRALAQLSIKAQTKIENVKNVIIWGNHSSTLYPDHNHAIIGQEKAINMFDEQWINNHFIPKIQKRGGEVLKARQNSSVLSAAVAIKDHLKNWIFGTKDGEFVSMGVYCDGSFYGLPQNFVFSVPVICKNFDYEVVKDLQISEVQKNRIMDSLKELQEEKEETLLEDNENIDDEEQNGEQQQNNS